MFSCAYIEHTTFTLLMYLLTYFLLTILLCFHVMLLKRQYCFILIHLSFIINHCYVLIHPQLINMHYCLILISVTF